MHNVQRSFIPGDSWVYYKMYTGEKTSDAILTQAIKPVVTYLLERGYIDHWFFIRYNDPKNHLRVRFHCTDTKYLGDIMRCVYEGVSAFAKAELLHKLQLDTYNRELERYGAEHIHLAEKLFFVESEMIVHFLDLIDGEEQELRWLFALRALDELLVDVGYDEEKKLNFMDGLRIGFGQEFGMNKSLKKQLDSKFRTHKQSISSFLNVAPEDKPEYQAIWDVLKKKRLESSPIIKELLNAVNDEQLNNYLGSYAHMLMNRMFRSKNRLHELVLYSFLFQHYKTAWGIKKFAPSK